MAKWAGIDISRTGVRVAVLQSGYRRTKLLALREEAIASHPSVEAALRAAMTGLRVDSSACALPGERGYYRLVQLPAAAQKELSSVLGFEVEATLPFELDDAVMDHRVLPRIPGVDDDASLPILTAVAHTDEVKAQIDLVRRALGQEPVRMGLGALPLANLAQLSLELHKPALAVLDLGDHQSDLLILNGGEARFSRTLSRGLVGLPGTADALARELRQTLGAWRATGGDKVAGVVLVGAGAETPGLSQFMTTEVGAPLMALPRLALDGVTPGDEAKLPRFAKAISLAMSLSGKTRDLDLRQGPLEAQHNYQFVREKTPLLAGLGTALMVSFAFSIYAELQALDTQKTLLEDQLAATTKVYFDSETRDPDQAAKMLDDAIAGKSDEPLPEIDGFTVMVEVSERIPKKITHDIAEFDFNKDAVTIKGVVSTIDEAHVVSSKLGEHPCFKDVNITRTTQLKSGAKQKYSLEFDVACGASKKGKKKRKGKK